MTSTSIGERHHQSVERHCECTRDSPYYWHCIIFVFHFISFSFFKIHFTKNLNKLDWNQVSHVGTPRNGQRRYRIAAGRKLRLPIMGIHGIIFSLSLLLVLFSLLFFLFSLLGGQPCRACHYPMGIVEHSRR